MYFNNPFNKKIKGQNNKNYSTAQLPYILDYGPEPFAVNLQRAVLGNTNFRTTLWTGNNLQITLMNIEPWDDIGVEMHPDHDQFLYIEDGMCIVRMGNSSEVFDFQATLYKNYAVVIPAGIWHNIYNIEGTPIKLFSIYAPPAHPYGTIDETKEDAEEENHY